MDRQTHTDSDTLSSNTLALQGSKLTLRSTGLCRPIIMRLFTFGLVSISPPATHLIVDVSVCNVDTMVTTPRTARAGASGPHTH